MARAAEPKLTRLNIRASEHEKQVISRAAEALSTTVSSFVLERAYEGAQAVLGEQNQFRLSEKKWQAFCKALDEPPKDIPALRKLLNERSIFDE